MTKKFLIPVSFLLYLFVGIQVAFAQGNPPQSAQDAAKMLEVFILGAIPIVGGMLGERVVHFIKKTPWLSDRDGDALKKLAVQLFGVGVPILLAWGMAYGMDLARYLDSHQIWPIVVAAWPVAHVMWNWVKTRQPQPTFAAQPYPPMVSGEASGPPSDLKSDLYTAFPFIIAKQLENGGYRSVKGVKGATDEQLLATVGPGATAKIREILNQ